MRREQKLTDVYPGLAEVMPATAEGARPGAPLPPSAFASQPTGGGFDLGVDTSFGIRGGVSAQSLIGAGLLIGALLLASRI